MKIPSIFVGMLGFAVLFSQVMAVASTDGPLLTTVTSGTVTKTYALKTTTYTDCPCETTPPASGIEAALSNTPVVVTSTSGGNMITISPGLMISVVGIVSGVVLLI